MKQLTPPSSPQKPKSPSTWKRLWELSKRPRRTEHLAQTTKVGLGCGAAEQLWGMFQLLFQGCVENGTVSQLWKHSTLVPIPKNNSEWPKLFHTSLVMKAMERVIKKHIINITDWWTFSGLRTVQVKGSLMLKHTSWTLDTSILNTPTPQPDSC